MLLPTRNLVEPYEKNNFKFLFKTEADEYKYMHMHENESDATGIEKLKTRLMYCDLLSN